jgi:hypothetical protein
MSGSFIAEKPSLKGQGFPICAAGAPLREEPFAQRRFNFALQNRLQEH